jgi:CpXC protein
MSLSSRVTHPCSRCAQPVDVVIYKSFVIDSDEALRTITQNRFHLVHCTRCGELRTFEADFLVTDQKRSMFVQVVERDDQVADMIDAMRSMLGGGVYARIVGARYDLVEKVRLWSQGLDDAAIEVLKYIIRLQLKDLEGKTKRYFERREGEDLVFSVVTPGQPVLATKLSMDLYRTMLGKLAESGIERGIEVDERLARRFLDAKPGAKASPA